MNAKQWYQRRVAITAGDSNTKANSLKEAIMKMVLNVALRFLATLLFLAATSHALDFSESAETERNVLERMLSGADEYAGVEDPALDRRDEGDLDIKPQEQFKDVDKSELSELVKEGRDIDTVDQAKIDDESEVERGVEEDSAINPIDVSELERRDKEDAAIKPEEQFEDVYKSELSKRTKEDRDIDIREEIKTGGDFEIERRGEEDNAINADDNGQYIDDSELERRNEEDAAIKSEEQFEDVDKSDLVTRDNGQLEVRTLDARRVRTGAVRLDNMAGGSIYVRGSYAYISSSSVTYFQLRPCLALAKVKPSLACVSLMANNRTNYYLRHYNHDRLYLEYARRPARNPVTFDVDASFILRRDRFHLDYFGFQSVNYPAYYIQKYSNRLKIAPLSYTTAYFSTASFAIVSRSTGSVGNQPRRPTSCQTIKLSNSRSTNGEYTIRTISGRSLKVYCEMSLYNGGFTYLNPSDLYRLTSDEVQAMFTDRSTFLMRLRRSDGKQSYASLKQHSNYRSVPLKLGLNENTDYSTPINVNYLERLYIYYGFLPKSAAAHHNTQGVQVKGYQISFTNCDASPNSYVALFPNRYRRKPTQYKAGTSLNSYCRNFFFNYPYATSSSSYHLPTKYFMFLEAHFGGCGCFAQTDKRLYYRGAKILGGTIGFR